MTSMTAHTALDPKAELGLEPNALPQHIAIIMDGNGRWARQRDQARIFGHQAGVESVRDIITHCGRLGIECLTLYSFSSENWKRPREEVTALMALYALHLVQERDELMENNVRLLQLGRRDNLPPEVVQKMDETLDMTAGNTGLTVALALNYGSRAEIVDAVRDIARRAQRGELDPANIDEGTISDALYTAGLPDPDLLIRTAGEMRISNFLLWQISYAELYVSPILWPDFRAMHLNEALIAYAKRQRRYGDVPPPPEHSAD
jgi:undecaprenyl diphosphate synthase